MRCRTMTILETARLREQTLALLFIERDEAAEQVAEQLDMIGYEKRKPTPMVLRGKPVMRVSTFGLTDTIQQVSIHVA
jgi:hypothetical protein